MILVIMQKVTFSENKKILTQKHESTQTKVKKLIMICAIISLISCKTTKPDGSLTWNTKQVNKAHNNKPFWAGGKLIQPVQEKKVKKPNI